MTISPGEGVVRSGSADAADAGGGEGHEALALVDADALAAQKPTGVGILKFHDLGVKIDGQLQSGKVLQLLCFHREMGVGLLLGGDSGPLHGPLQLGRGLGLPDGIAGASQPTSDSTITAAITRAVRRFKCCLMFLLNVICGGCSYNFRILIPTRKVKCR